MSQGHQTIAELETMEMTSPPTSEPEPKIASEREDSSMAAMPTASVDSRMPGATAQEYPDVGRLRSWRGIMVLLVTCCAQMMDNVFVASVNMSLPAISEEFRVSNAELQWLVSGYTLTFGGFLLLAGMLSDRYGRRNIFCAGMAWLAAWTLGCGFARSFIQLAVFRGLQGIGAAMTVPAGVGILSSFFVGQDRSIALVYFGSAGCFGLSVGLLLGGFVTSSLGWRCVFYVTIAFTACVGALAWIVLPRDRREGDTRSQLDILGAGMSTVGLILLSFVIANGNEYGWSKPFIIVLLIVSILVLLGFALEEKKVSNPVMPLSLWKGKNFAALWITGFVAYGGWQSIVYYATLISQEIMLLSPGETALGLLPMCGISFILCIGLGPAIERVEAKWLLLAGLALCLIGPLPSAILPRSDVVFWRHILPTSIIGITGMIFVYCTITIVLLKSVPANAKSLCGGMVNTAFQVGGGNGLAITTAIVSGSAGDQDKLVQYRIGMWCCVGFATVGFLCTGLGVRK